MTEPTPPGTPPTEAEALAELERIRGQKFTSNRAVLAALYHMIRENRSWWLLPPLVVLAFLSLFVSLTGNSSILPAIYALF